MAAMHTPETLEAKECANCGATDGLGKCSRCHSAYFCSVKCQKAYWPFHKDICRRNDFADALEATEPKFARWMRKHGKQAVLRDDEVDRLERAGKATSGFSRQEVMESMYGRANPIPLQPSYTAEERLAVAHRDEDEAVAMRAVTDRERRWASVEIPPALGVSTTAYKWKQNQTFVEIYFQLPTNLPTRAVVVSIEPRRLHVSLDGADKLSGELLKEVDVDGSTWFVSDGLLHIHLLKRNRRGHYDDGSTNNDTFWTSVLYKAPANESLALPVGNTGYAIVPTEYFSSEYEFDGGPNAHAYKKRGKAIKAR